MAIQEIEKYIGIIGTIISVDPISYNIWFVGCIVVGSVLLFLFFIPKTTIIFWFYYYYYNIIIVYNVVFYI